MSAHGSVVEREPCPACGSRDNVAVYEDGYRKCFGMGCEYYVMPDGDKPQHTRKPMSKGETPMIHEWELQALTKRNISESTVQRWKYGIAEYKGKKVQVANYFRDGGLVAQKIRFPSKDFVVLGYAKSMGLYGQHLCRDGGKYLTITEGEIDALSVSQVFNGKWPVVSVPNGAQGAARAIKAEYDFVNKFETVVLMFDNDQPGRDAAEEVAALLPPGKVKIASLPMKDANEMLKAGRGAEIVDAFWGARDWRPDGILRLADIREDLKKPVEIGVPWPWEKLTAATYGRRDGELYALGAGTGIGKTDWFTQVIVHDAEVLGVNCGVIYLEQPPRETGQRLAGKLAGKRFHVPDGSWTQDELNDAVDRLADHDKIVLYNHFGVSDWDVIESRIRYMVVSLDCKHIFLDHLTALAAHEEDERKALDRLLADIAGLAQELRIKFHFISHLATPEGKPHEEGGRVMIRHFRGSRSLGYWSHYMFAMERDQQHEEKAWRETTTFRILKDRYTGQATGQTIALKYDHTTGLLAEGDFPDDKDSPFPDDSPQEDF